MKAYKYNMNFKEPSMKGGQLWTYKHGSLELAATYTNESMTECNPNPAIIPEGMKMTFWAPEPVDVETRNFFGELRDKTINWFGEC